MRRRPSLTSCPPTPLVSSDVSILPRFTSALGSLGPKDTTSGLTTRDSGRSVDSAPGVDGPRVYVGSEVGWLPTPISCLSGCQTTTVCVPTPKLKGGRPFVRDNPPDHQTPNLVHVTGERRWTFTSVGVDYPRWPFLGLWWFKW